MVIVIRLFLFPDNYSFIILHELLPDNNNELHFAEHNYNTIIKIIKLMNKVETSKFSEKAT